MILRRWHKLLIGILIMLAIVAKIMVVPYLQSQNWFQPRATQADVRRQIEQGLPLGSTVQQAVAFLGTRGWLDPKNVSIYPNRDDKSNDFEQKDLSGWTLLAAIPDAYPGFLVSGGIFMKFGFNVQRHLTRYQLDDIYTGM